jgi:hypothetical protein
MMDDPDAIALMAEELMRQPALTVTIRAQDVMVLVGALQLATRHRSLTPNVRDTIGRFIEGARTYFAECPFVLEAIRMGERPEYDR